MIVGLVLSFVGTVLFVWMVLRLAVLAMPTWAALAVFVWGAVGAAGVLLGALLGGIAGVMCLLVFRALVASHLPAPLRAAAVLGFVLPAGLAGHGVVAALMRLGGARPIAANGVALLGGLVVALAALTRIAGRPRPHEHDALELR